jgi:hypothetical protein
MKPLWGLRSIKWVEYSEQCQTHARLYISVCYITFCSFCSYLPVSVTYTVNLRKGFSDKWMSALGGCLYWLFSVVNKLELKLLGWGKSICKINLQCLRISDLFPPVSSLYKGLPFHSCSCFSWLLINDGIKMTQALYAHMNNKIK